MDKVYILYRVSNYENSIEKDYSFSIIGVFRNEIDAWKKLNDIFLFNKKAMPDAVIYDDGIDITLHLHTSISNISYRIEERSLR